MPTPCSRPRSRPAPTTSSTTETATRSICDQRELGEVTKALEARFGEPRKSGLVWRAQNTVAVDDEAGEKLIRLVETLEDHDDVQNVFVEFRGVGRAIAKLEA